MNNELLNVSDLKSDIEKDIGNYGEYFVDYPGCQYICDVISEIADSYIDIYYYDLFEWCKYNYEWVEEAISQGLCDLQQPDIPRMIQAGQYKYIQNDLYKNLDNAILNFCLNYIEYDLQIKEISNEQYEELETLCTDVDNNNTLDIFTDFCNELFNKEEV